MSLIKSTGNMYPWVTHMHSHLRGACPHACPYCYATRGRAARFAQGPLTFKADELNVGYGSVGHVPKTIFIEHTHDLFAEAVKTGWITAILKHCRETPYNRYVFQTRNTQRAEEWYGQWPADCVIGTTIETSRAGVGKAPNPVSRALGLRRCKQIKPVLQTFVTIEPVLDHDTDEMLGLLATAAPDFVNIGADSKGCGLKEPSADKILALIAGISALGIEIRQKKNLARIIGTSAA